MATLDLEVVFVAYHQTFLINIDSVFVIKVGSNLNGPTDDTLEHLQSIAVDFKIADLTILGVYNNYMHDNLT
jgi:hypothetical protein